MCIFVPIIGVLLLCVARWKGLLEDQEFMGYSILLFVPVIIMILVYLCTEVI